MGLLIPSPGIWWMRLVLPPQMSTKCFLFSPGLWYMEAIVHLTSSDPDHWQLASGRVDRLLQAEVAPERITLLADIDGAWLLTEDAATTDGVVDLLDKGVRVATNRNCLENRDISVEEVIDGVAVLENSTLELVRLQDSGASIVKVP